MTESTARKQRAITSENVKPESPAARIIAKFGGLSRFCELCDFPVGTVHGWMVKGLVPAKTRQHGEATVSYTAWIMLKAREHEIGLEALDFIDRLGDLDG